MSGRTITVRLEMDLTGNAVTIDVSVVPPIPWEERMMTRLEKVAKQMLDAAADGGVIAKSYDPRESSLVGTAEGIEK